MKHIYCYLFAALFISTNVAIAQTDSTATDSTSYEEEDFSIYDDLEFVDESAKRFASVKVSGKSPDKLISIGYDWQGAYDMNLNRTSLMATTPNNLPDEKAKVNSTQGIRLGANIPVISKNNIIIQAGFDYWEVNYDFENQNQLTNPIAVSLAENGLTTLGLKTTVYKPLSETSFLIGLAGITMSGDYDVSELQNGRYNRGVYALLWGKKPNDYKQWAVGLSRTYRAGELNYIPVVMYNWTAINRKWGVETLFPARGDVRYNFNPRSMLFFGFDLEGNSYRIGNQGQALPDPLADLELRRSELRFRFKYERQIKGFLWLSANAGYRYDWSFNTDRVPGGDDFFRGFFGDQEYIMENELTNPLFFSFSINLVSP